MRVSLTVVEVVLLLLFDDCLCHQRANVGANRLSAAYRPEPYRQVVQVKAPNPFARVKPTVPPNDKHVSLESWWANNEQMTRKNYRIEQIKEKILRDAGLSGPVNMTGVVIPAIPGLARQIEEVNKLYQPISRNHSARADSRQRSKQVMAADQPYTKGPIESTFFVAQHAPEWLDLPDTPGVIYFNLSHQDPATLQSAHLSLWVHPAEGKGQPTKHSDHSQYSRTCRPTYDKKRKSPRREHSVPRTLKRPNKKSQKISVRVVVERIVTSFNVTNKKTIFEKKHQTFDCPLQSKHGHWVRVQLTDIVKSWLLYPSTNLGFTITTETRGSSLMVSSGMFSKPEYVPVLELQQSPDNSDRQRRFANNLTCSDHRDSVCCRDSLTVNFVDLHWDFIVAPKSYEANLCRGSCPFLYAQKYPHSVLVQKMFNSSDARFGACCGARVMEPLKMIYYDGAKIRVTDIKDMVVVACGCS